MDIRKSLHNLVPVKSFSQPAKMMLIATVIDGTIYSGWSLFFNFFVLARGFDSNFLGLANSLPSLAALIFGIPLGMLSDRIGRRKSMIIGLLLNTSTCLMQVLTPSGPMLLVMAFISGLGSTLYSLSQYPLLMKSSNEEHRALLFSLNYGLLTLSGAVGSLVAGYMPQLFGGLMGIDPESALAYGIVLGTCVVLGALSLIPVGLMREPPDPHKADNQPQARPSEVLTRPMIWKVVTPNLLIGFGAAITIPYLNLFFATRFEMPDSTLGVLFSLSALLTGIGCVVGPKMADRLGGKIRTVVITQGLSLGFLLLIGFSPVAWLAAIGFLARAVLMNMANPLFAAFALEQFDSRQQGVANSLMNVTWTLGWSVGPYLSGIIQNQAGFTPLFVLTGIFYGLSTLAVWVMFSKTEAQAKAAADLEASLADTNPIRVS